MELVMGSSILPLLERVSHVPECFREVLVCTPYLDEATISLLASIALSARRAQCGFQLVTRSDPARRLLARMPGPIGRWQHIIRVRRRLHAKVYMALARRPRESEAIITSANLTLDGLETNDELGIMISGGTEVERLLLDKIRHIFRVWTR